MEAAILLRGQLRTVEFLEASPERLANVYNYESLTGAFPVGGWTKNHSNDPRKCADATIDVSVASNPGRFPTW